MTKILEEKLALTDCRSELLAKGGIWGAGIAHAVSTRATALASLAADVSESVEQYARPRLIVDNAFHSVRGRGLLSLWQPKRVRRLH